MNEKITKYILETPEEQQKIMETLRMLILSENPSVTENFKWGRPVFATDMDVAYFKATKSYLTFGIFNYEKIKDHVHLLEGTGKNMRHIKIKKYEDLQPEVIKTWIRKITTLD